MFGAVAGHAKKIINSMLPVNVRIFTLKTPNKRNCLAFKHIKMIINFKNTATA